MLLLCTLLTLSACLLFSMTQYTNQSMCVQFVYLYLLHWMCMKVRDKEWMYHFLVLDFYGIDLNCPLDVVSMHGSHNLSSSSVLAMRAVNLKTYGWKRLINGMKLLALRLRPWSLLLKTFISTSHIVDSFNKI